MKDLNTFGVLALHHCIVLSSPPRLVRVRVVSLLLLEVDLLVGLVGVPVTSSWKVVKGPGLLLRGACEMVVELAISRVEEKLAIRKGTLSFVVLAWRRR